MYEQKKKLNWVTIKNRKSCTTTTRAERKEKKKQIIHNQLNSIV